MIDFVANIWDGVNRYIAAFTGFYWFTFLQYLFKVTAAFVITLPLALEREFYSRSLGLRTFPLVAVASCAYVLIAESFIGEGNPDAKARIMQGLMTGIGFIGGGAILKEGKNQIIGTATAVSLWSTGTVGAAIAFNRFEIGILVAGVNFLALRVLSPIKAEIGDGDAYKDEITTADDDDEEEGS